MRTFKVFPDGTTVEDLSWDDAFSRIIQAINTTATGCTKKR